MIVIVGAGAAGLAAAFYLKKANLPFIILEKDEVGATWGKHYQGMKLHSLKQVSALPGLKMPSSYPAFPSGPQVKNYLQDYAKKLELPIQQVEVIAVDFDDKTQLWQLETLNRNHISDTISSPIVILATGIWNQPYIPNFEGLDRTKIKVIHAKNYQKAQDFKGLRLLVVGAGNSGAEIAVQLAQAGIKLELVVRDGLLLLPYPRSVLGSKLSSLVLHHSPKVLKDKLLGMFRRGYPELGLPLPSKAASEAYPVISPELVPLVKLGKIKVRPGIRAFTATEVIFENGDKGVYEVVVMARG
ncbi:MAG: NAD(P)/FAD-dependent oxidoreductase [Deinococcales bacterium]